MTPARAETRRSGPRGSAGSRTHRTEPSGRARPVAWFEIVGKHGEGLRAFYSQLFGWETVEVAPGADYGVMDAAAHGIGGGIGSRAGGHVTVFIEVDDLEGTLQRAERLGGKTIAGPTTFPDKRPSARGRGSVTFAYFEDPEGHIIGLSNGIVR